MTRRGSRSRPTQRCPSSRNIICSAGIHSVPPPPSLRRTVGNVAIFALDAVKHAIDVAYNNKEINFCE